MLLLRLSSFGWNSTKLSGFLFLGLDAHKKHCITIYMAITATFWQSIWHKSIPYTVLSRKGWYRYCNHQTAACNCQCTAQCAHGPKLVLMAIPQEVFTICWQGETSATAMWQYLTKLASMARVAARLKNVLSVLRICGLHPMSITRFHPDSPCYHCSFLCWDQVPHLLSTCSYAFKFQLW